MIIFFFIAGVLAGPSRLLVNHEFISSGKIEEGTLVDWIGKLKSVQEGYEKFQEDLLNWAKDYHKFKEDLEKNMLSELLTREGLNEFKKELRKCGLSGNLENEDLTSISKFCINQKSIQDYIELIFLKIFEASNICINVKEKYRSKIQKYYDEYFHHEELIIQEKIPEYPVLTELDSKNLFSKIIKTEQEPLQVLCNSLQTLSSQLSHTQNSSEQTISSLFNSAN